MQGWFPNFAVECNECNDYSTYLFYHPERHEVFIKCICQEASLLPTQFFQFNANHDGLVACIRSGKCTYSNKIPSSTPPIPLSAHLEFMTEHSVIQDYKKQLQQKTMPGWFPNFPLQCTKCGDTYHARLIFLDKEIMNANCNCTTSETLQLAFDTEMPGHYLVWTDGNLRASMTLSGNEVPLPMHQRLTFRTQNDITRKWQHARSDLQEIAVPRKKNNNNAEKDRIRDLEEHLVIVQNEVHKLSNELETQTIMMHEEISKMQRKLFRNELMCVICQTNQIDTVVECGHVYCTECVQNIAKCAFCRKQVDVTTIKKIYL